MKTKSKHQIKSKHTKKHSKAKSQKRHNKRHKHNKTRKGGFKTSFLRQAQGAFHRFTQSSNEKEAAQKEIKGITSNIEEIRENIKLKNGAQLNDEEDLMPREAVYEEEQLPREAEYGTRP